MRFRRRAKIFPGVYLNFSASGISTTIGPKGMNINFSKNGTYLNTGIPGTGLYDRHRLDSNQKFQDNTAPEFSQYPSTLINESDLIQTKDIEATTSEGLNELKKTLIDCFEERIEIEKEISKMETSCSFASFLYFISYLLVIGFFIKWFKNNFLEKREDLIELKQQLADCYIDLDFHLDPIYDNQFSNVHQSFRILASCEKIWDLTSESSIDRHVQRTSASSAVKRERVQFSYKNIDIIKTKYSPMHLENANGGNIFIYPTFIAIINNAKSFGLIDIRDLNFSFNMQKFIETESLATDADVVDKTWTKVNKDGSPDKRFKENYQIPVCKYGEISLKTSSGLNEAYAMSSFKKSQLFAIAFMDFQRVVKEKKIA